METNPSFYKILMDMSIPRILRIPEGFMDKHGDIFTSEMKLQNALGATWEVKFEKVVEDDRHGFTTGWPEFCSDMGLQIFELLVFSYAGDATFHVSVYATTALEKPLHARAFQNPRWHVKLQHYNALKLHIPSPFAAEAGLVGKKKIKLEYCDDGQSGEAKLNSCKGRIAFGSGWTQFRKKNKLTEGESYTLEFVPLENVIRVWPYPYHL